MTEAKKWRPGQVEKNAVPEAPGTGGGKNPNIITNWPEEKDALIVKFLVDPTYDNGKKMYRPARYFGHPTGNKERDKSNHICLSFFGATSSPENDVFWENVKILGALKKEKKDGTPEYEKHKALVKTFKPKERGYWLIVQPNSPVIQAIRVPGPAMDVLLGRKADNYHKEAIPSLVESMTKAGASPFDLNNTKGWVKLFKKGEGMDTEYFVQVAQIDAVAETKDGKKIKYQEDVEASVDPFILGDELDTTHIPNVVEFEKKYSWTAEESQKFVAMQGTLAGVPERALKRESRESAEAPEAPEASSSTPTTVAEYQKVSEDDIPY